MKIIPLFIFILLACAPVNLIGQSKTPDVTEWARKLADPADTNNFYGGTLSKILRKMDSVSAVKFLEDIALEPVAKNPYFIARYNCTKAGNDPRLKYQFPYSPTPENEIKKNEITKLMEVAMHKAYESGDDHLAIFVSTIYGNFMSHFGNMELAVMYLMNTADLYEKIKSSAPYEIYYVLGELLWKVKEYPESIQYSKRALIALKTSESTEQEYFGLMFNNTIGLAFHRMEEYDSAFIYYKKGLALAEKIENSTWIGIISGNMAQIYFVQGKYATALPIFMMDYESSQKVGYADNAANSLQWAAKTNLVLGNKSLALAQIREAFALLKTWPNTANYRKNASHTASEIFEALGKTDSAYYYSSRYAMLHDSLERVAYRSSVDISKLRLTNERSRYNIQNLEREKDSQLQKRNYIIGGILLISALVLLLISRQGQKLKYTSRIAHSEKKVLEEEMESARTQMKLFTQSIVEKTTLIEKLQKQKVVKEVVTAEDEELIEELSRQTILTEDDWINYKKVFEKIHPQFFEKLKNRVQDITMADRRLAALTRLQFTTHQMAAVLGISSNSVFKAKQRLRKRLELETDQEAEEFIGGI